MKYLCVHLFLLLLLAGPVQAQADQSKIIAKNLTDGQAALKKKDFAEALLCCKAVLKLDPENQPALELKSDAFLGLNRKDEALDSALEGYDAPKRGDSGAKSRSGRLGKRVKDLAPALASFLELRDVTVSGLVTIARRADKEGRKLDGNWIWETAGRVFPAHEAVETQLKGRNTRLKENGVEDGFTDLIQGDADWVYYNEDPACKITNDLLTLKNKNRQIVAYATYMKRKLSQDFTVRFTAMSRPRDGKFNNIRFIFPTVPDVSEPDPVWALALDAKVDRCVRLAHLDNQGRWNGTDKFMLDDGVCTQDEWGRYELSWDDSARRLLLRCGGYTLFNLQVEESVKLGRYLRFGVDDAIDLQVKDLRATLE